jgi:hypothetical protein
VGCSRPSLGRERLGASRGTTCVQLSAGQYHPRRIRAIAPRNESSPGSGLPALALASRAVIYSDKNARTRSECPTQRRAWWSLSASCIFGRERDVTNPARSFDVGLSERHNSPRPSVRHEFSARNPCVNLFFNHRMRQSVIIERSRFDRWMGKSVQAGVLDRW